VYGEIISRDSAKRLKWSEPPLEQGGSEAPAAGKVMPDDALQPHVVQRKSVRAPEAAR
jgi:hypothetical protein